MMLPAWARDWRVLVGGGVLGALAVWAAWPKSASSPSSAGASPLPGGPVQVPASAPLVAAPGATYFATLTTHGALNVATVGSVHDRAVAEGFADVVVSATPVPHWPPLAAGDYFVRGTFVGKDSKVFPRHVSAPLGSLDVVDVWRA